MDFHIFSVSWFCLCAGLVHEILSDDLLNNLDVKNWITLTGPVDSLLRKGPVNVSQEVTSTTQMMNDKHESSEKPIADNRPKVADGDVLWTERDSPPVNKTGNYELKKELDRSKVTGNITWRLETKEQINVQVQLQQELVKTLPIISTINMSLITDYQKNKFKCGTLRNVTCGPIIKIETELSPNHIYQTPVVKIKLNLILHNLSSCVDNEQWKDDGVTTSFDTQFVICLSTHLTLFSVLLDPRNETEPDDPVLTAISVTGSLTSISCLLLTIAMYCSKKPPSGSETSKILIHGSVALLLTHISFQVYHWFGEFVICSIISYATHYSVAAFLLWTACDGINMWRILLNEVFNTRGNVFYQGYKVVSWGIPLLTTTIGWLITDHAKVRTKCALRFDGVCEMVLYIVPCTLILGCNVSLFTWMLVNVMCKDNLGQLRKKKVGFLLALYQVFGIGWCVAFPLLWLGSTRRLGQYLFATLVSTQGMLIFAMRCAPDAEFKKVVFRYLCACTPAVFHKNDPTHSTSSELLKSKKYSSADVRFRRCEK